MDEETDMKSNVHFRHCGVPCCGVCKWFDKPYEYAFCHCKDADMTARLSVKEDMVCDKYEPNARRYNVYKLVRVGNGCDKEWDESVLIASGIAIDGSVGLMDEYRAVIDAFDKKRTAQKKVSSPITWDKYGTAFLDKERLQIGKY